MKVICVCTELKHKWLDDWLEAAAKWGYEGVVLGQGHKWQGFGTKMNLVSDYTRGLPEEEIVAVVDCYDLLMAGPVDELLQKFLSTTKPLLLGAEAACGPNCEPIVETFTTCPEKNVNGGFVMGSAAMVCHAYSEARLLCSTDDQLGLGRYVNAHRELCHLDSTQTVVCNFSKLGDLTRAPNGRFFNPAHNTTPCAVHIVFIDKDLGLRNDFVREHALTGWLPSDTRLDWLSRIIKRVTREIILNPCYDKITLAVISCLTLVVVGAVVMKKRRSLSS